MRTSPSAKVTNLHSSNIGFQVQPNVCIHLDIGKPKLAFEIENKNL